MADAIRSTTPTAVIQFDLGNEALQLVVTNPAPTGSRPDVTTNSIYRRPSGSTGVWTLAGTTGKNGTFTDFFQRSAATFDYFVRTDSGADSTTVTGTTPTVTGMWAYSSSDQTTLTHFPYTDGHAETLDEVETVLQFVGRQYGVVESGLQETQTVSVNVRIPFSDPSWRAQVEWWRARKRDRQTILYRDGRGRTMPVRIVGAVQINPSSAGATITCTFNRVDYASSTITIDPAYYQAGAYNDGGNGIYGNGLQGNGY